MMYRCKAVSTNAFVRQLALRYLARGHFFYVQGSIPEKKNPCLVDERLIRKYGVDISKDQRYRRKKIGKANVHYLRFERRFLLLASKGEHRFFQPSPVGEGDVLGNCGDGANCRRFRKILDAREIPVKFGGYQLRVCERCGGGWRVNVFLDDGELKRIRRLLLARALVWPDKERLEKLLWCLPYDLYGPMRGQLKKLVKEVNGVRRKAGYRERLSLECIRYYLQPIKIFE